jgi:general L-amino acid transport system permease protein
MLLVIAATWFLISTLLQNLALRNLHFGFGFLFAPAHFDIPFHLIGWTTFDTNGRALLVSLLNTLLVSAMGIIAATILGVAAGIMRLSINWLVRNVALCFVEFIRNTPLLVQIIFWYFAVLQTLPAPRQSIALPGGLLLNIRGLYIPDIVMRDGSSAFSWLAGLALIVTPFTWHLRFRGHSIGRKALVLPLIAVSLYATAIEKIEVPSLAGFNIQGGTQVPPELVALWAGLSIYIGAFIAEIVRASIEAVPKGQSEAARSLGLRTSQVMFLVVLPQALRMMVPQLTSQYLNLIKSSTLGAAIAYPEIGQIFAGTVLNQANKEAETIIVVMAVFLSISLLFSTFMNWYNKRIALVEQ